MSEAKAVELFNAPLPIATRATSILDVIDRAATDPTVDVTKLEKLLSMYERVQDREAEQQYNAAMTAAQTEMRPISQDASNPQTRSKYASFAALDNRMRPLYTKHGFSLSFDTGSDAPEGHVRVICRVAHKDGHGERPHLDMPSDGKGAKGGDVMTKTHATMAALSYAKRGLLKMIFNIAEGEGDTDGNEGDSNAMVTDEQIQTVKDMIARSGADIEKLCRYFKVEALRDIRTKDYPRVIEALNLKLHPKPVKTL